MALNQPLVCEVVIGLGLIPLAPYGTPGTPELAKTLEPLIPQYDAILMANHGVVTYGTDLQSAYQKFFKANCSIEAVRAAEVSGFDKSLWERLCATGATTMASLAAMAAQKYAGQPALRHKVGD